GRAWLEKGLAALDSTSVELGALRAKALCMLSWLTMFQGNWFGAIGTLEESIQLSRTAPGADASYLSKALNLLSSARVYSDVPSARALSAESVTICRSLAPTSHAATWDLAEALYYDGDIATDAGDNALARARAEESHALYRQAGDIWE